MNMAEKSNGMAVTYVVYVVILAIAVFQVVFAFELGPSLTLMMMIAALQASLAVLYFMHLGKERPGLVLALIPYTMFVLFMMNMIWSDSFRLLHMRPH
jgi:heme/copper-type cytochrome/quinol oxidase subunit 4